MIAQSGILGLLFWGIYDNKFYKSYLFVALFLLSVLIGFIVSGNRTSIIMSFVLVYFCWYFHTGRVFSLKVAVITFMAFVAVSVASDIRGNGYDSVSSRSLELNASSRVNELLDLRMERATVGNATFGVISAIDTKKLTYILGESYYSILFIPIPGTLLDEGKPYAEAGSRQRSWQTGTILRGL